MMKNIHLRSWCSLGLYVVLSGCILACSEGPSTNQNSGGTMSAAVASTPLAIGDPDCSYGGILVQTGIDLNMNGTLDTSEVDNTQKVCNGAPGSAGSNGTNALITVTAEPAGSSCAAGGKRIDSGLDANATGILEYSEIVSTGYICNGVPGTGFVWIDVTGLSVQAQPNTGYLADSPQQVTVTLPATPMIGDVVRVSGIGAGGWRITQNTGQSIITSNLTINGSVAVPRNILTGWNAAASSADGRKLVAVASGGYIWTSGDSGVTWTPHESARQWRAVASSADGVRLVALVSNDRIYTSDDSGATWTQRDIARNWAYVASSSDGTKLAACAADGILVSTDAGITWTLSRTFGGADWCTSIASSADGMTLTAGSKTAVHRSTDGGATWTPLSLPAGVPYLFSMVSSADGMKLAAMYNEPNAVRGHVYLSADGGANWTQSDPYASGYAGPLASSADGTVLMSVAYGNPVMMSVDSGATWTVRADISCGVIAVSADGSKAVIAQGNNGLNQIFSLIPTHTSIGPNGSISGDQYDAIELQYVGGGTFSILSHEGNLIVE